MAINQHLGLKQSQSLTMTPQLQQAIKLLQLSNIELSEFVAEELEKNPLLEKKEEGLESDTPPEDVSHAEAQYTEEKQIDEMASSFESDMRESNGLETDGNFTASKDDVDADFDNVFTGGGKEEIAQGSDGETLPDYDRGSSAADMGSGGNLNFEHPDFSLENTLSDELTLRDFLLEQFCVKFPEVRDRMIGTLFIDRLDAAGYLNIDLPVFAQKLGCSEDYVDYILEQLQGFEPTGIFARNLGECLALQLKENDRLDWSMEMLLNNLDILAMRDFDALQEICRVDYDDLMEMVVEIQSLDPRPASKFDHFVTQTVIPDVFMKSLPKEEGGGWGVELNSDTLPKVLVNQTYYTEVKEGTQDKESHKYLKDQLEQANWLVRAMDQRANTILKVSAEIIKKQENFFTYGVEYLKPMVLREIAESIDMHESTISRVTTNKYIGTSRGVFELKYFFSSSISSSAGGVDLSSEAVKAKIKTLIDAELPTKILSDDAIVTALKTDNVSVARRTVAKYRESMKIPSSVQRRREKKHLR